MTEDYLPPRHLLGEVPSVGQVPPLPGPRLALSIRQPWARPVLYTHPIPYKGRLGFFPVELP